MIYSYGLYHIQIFENLDKVPPFLPLAHIILFWLSVVLLVCLLPTYIMSVFMDPGYLVKKYDYIKLIDKALENQVALDRFCSYDEVMKTATSFHCNTCGRCVEHFDHHCPFINNCLGYRNHKYFMIFIVSYSLFLFAVLLETMRHFTEVCLHKQTIKQCIKSETLMFVVLILVILHMPIIFYQLYAQLKTICATKENRLVLEGSSVRSTDV